MPFTVVVMGRSCPSRPAATTAREDARRWTARGGGAGGRRGTRLRPLTRLRPKALCPVGNVPLVDLALERVRPAVDAVAVNLHHGRRTLDAHLADDVHRSVEEEQPARHRRRARATCGLDRRSRRRWSSTPTPGARARWTPSSAGWDGERIRLLLAGRRRAPTRPAAIAGALMPWRDVERARRRARRASTRRRGGRPQAAGRLEVVRHDGPFVDCGTPRQYLEANLPRERRRERRRARGGGGGHARPLRGVERRARCSAASSCR